uniref:Uncharacterized protein n=1 Tax=Anguilla anguilla TaxID=7936 RepID=A0A0E9WRH1_ANGAN
MQQQVFGGGGECLATPLFRLLKVYLLTLTILSIVTVFFVAVVGAVVVVITPPDGRNTSFVPALKLAGFTFRFSPFRRTKLHQ